MACELPHIRELEINPLLADEREVVAVDCRILVEHPQPAATPYAHMAIHPYPSQLETRTQLPDGSELEIRPMRPEDAEIEQEFVRGLSPESRYFRFMQSITELTPDMLVRLTQPDYDNELALSALVLQDGSRSQIGVARYAIDPDQESCEFALVVSDQWRHQGIGSRLMKQLLEAARHRGLKRMRAEVLVGNQQMLALTRELGFSQRPSPEDPGVRIVERKL
jgi:acetyltransferase